MPAWAACWCGIGAWCRPSGCRSSACWTATVDVSRRPRWAPSHDVPPSTERQEEEGDHAEGHQQQDEQDDQADASSSDVRARHGLATGVRRRRRGWPWVRPVAAGTAWVAPTAAIMEVMPGSPASTGRPSAKRSRSARSSSAGRVAVVGELGHGLHDHGLECHRDRPGSPPGAARGYRARAWTPPPRESRP